MVHRVSLRAAVSLCRDGRCQVQPLTPPAHLRILTSAQALGGVATAAWQRLTERLCRLRACAAMHCMVLKQPLLCWLQQPWPVLWPRGSSRKQQKGPFMLSQEHA